MVVLGIETSCDDTSVALLEVVDGVPTVLVNEVSSQGAVHEAHGGIVPLLAAREHEKNLPVVLKSVLQRAGAVFKTTNTTEIIKRIECVAVTRGPGLAPSLLMGVSFARLFALTFKKPIVGVNHLEGHIFSPMINSENIRAPLRFPFISLIVSGGHTELLLVRGVGEYEMLGKTHDDACGEAFDKVGRLLGFSYPGGPQIEKVAREYTPEPKEKLLFSPPMLHSKDYNFSYSGLKTAVLYFVKNSQFSIINSQTTNKVAYHFQEAALAPLVEKTVTAAREYNISTIFVVGGVAANQRLAKLLNLKIANCKLKISLFFPDKYLTQDNATMIAYAGYLQFFARGKDDVQKLSPDPNLKLSAI